MGGFDPAWDRLLTLTDAETKVAMMAEEKVATLDAGLIEIARTAMPNPRDERCLASKVGNPVAVHVRERPAPSRD